MTPTEENAMDESVSLTEPQRKWIEALRSGRFKQGRGSLRDAHDNHCCLGVACELFREDLGLITSRVASGNHLYSEPGRASNAGVPPVAVALHR
jgi:hypothetical protein